MWALASFTIGFASGWGARSAVDSPRGLALRSFAVYCAARARLERWAARETERIADLMAEVRSQHEGTDLEGHSDASSQEENLP
jgi:hypothetical protein